MSDLPYIILFETDSIHLNLLPLAYTRPVADFRVGMYTLREKWEMRLPGNYSYITVESLSQRYPVNPDGENDAIYIAGNVVADDGLVSVVRNLAPGDKIVDSDGLVAFRGSRKEFLDGAPDAKPSGIGDVSRIRYVYDIFLLNGQQICSDYKLAVAGRESQTPPADCMVIGNPLLSDGIPALFIEEGAELDGAVINLKDGPVYIGKNATVMEGSLVRGPLAVMDNAKVRMGAKIYGNTTIGPFCKVGGEVDNAVMFGYSNKAHDGYLGNAVIGEWCNIGAGVNASNLKNDYSKIRIWNYAQRRFMRTNLQFCGLIMGDHSKAGINCMFNTATVVGVGVNLHGAGFPRVFIPSFSQGSPEGGFTDVDMKKFLEIAERVMSRRNITLSDADREMFENIYKFASELK